MATVDTLLVRIEADMSDLRKQLNRSTQAVSQSVKKQQTAFSNLGRSIKGLIGVAVAFQAVRFAGHMINMASAAEEMASKSNVVFGEFVGQVRADLTEFGDTVGRSTQELEMMASSVQDTFVPMGFARGEASKLSVQLTKLAVDVASFNNASDADTMRAFQSAIVGNHETVRRFGIVITEATLQGELFRMGINKTTQNATNAEKVQARLNLIMAGTTDAQGDATKTADTFANRSKALGAALEELTVEVVTPLLNSMAGLVGMLVNATVATKNFLKEIGFIPPDLSKLTGILEEQKKLQQEIDRLEDLRSRRQSMPKVQAQIDIEIKKLKDQLSVLKKLEEAKKPKKLQDTSENIAKQTTAEMKATAKMKDEMLKLANANEVLKMRIEGRSEAEIRAFESRIKHHGASGEFLAPMEAEIEKNEKLKKSLDEITVVRTQQKKDLDELKKFTTPVLTETEVLLEIQQQLNDAYATGAISQDQYNIGVEKLGQKLLEASESGKLALKAIEDVSGGFADEFANAMMTGELSMKSLKNVVADAMASIIRDFIKARIQAMLLKMVLGMTTGAPSSGQFTGSGNLSGVGGYAGGGTVQAKTPIMVGERGAEMFIPNTGGVVRNAQDTRMASGGKPVIVNQNINISTGVAQTVRAEVMNMMPQISQSTIQAVVDAKQRGGSFATIMS